jgi:hypothetical protein
MKWIPAGVSQRTGKAYSGFYSCPNRCPKPARTYAPKPDFNQAMDKKNEMIQHAQASKEEGIRVAGAKSIAGNIVAAMIHAGELKGSDWRIQFDNIYKYVYNYQPGLRSEPEAGVNIPFPED